MPKMERFQQLFNMQGRGQGGGAPDAPVVDTSEKLHISSLALLKMLKHGEVWFVAIEQPPYTSIGLIVGCPAVFTHKKVARQQFGGLVYWYYPQENMLLSSACNRCAAYCYRAQHAFVCPGHLGVVRAPSP